MQSEYLTHHMVDIWQGPQTQVAASVPEFSLLHFVNIYLLQFDQSPYCKLVFPPNEICSADSSSAALCDTQEPCKGERNHAWIWSETP